MTNTSRVQIELAAGPVTESVDVPFSGAGAVVTFDGVVRPNEDGRLLLGLHYTSYDPMAENELRRIAVDAIVRHDLLYVAIVHSRGLVLSGELSLRILVAASHRKPAFKALDEILDALKRDVPIWKLPVFADTQGVG